MSDIKTDAIERAIAALCGPAIELTNGPGGMSTMVAVQTVNVGIRRRLQELQDAAKSELTALRARVERGEAGWEAFDRVQRNDWIIATAYDGQNFGYVVNTRDGEPRNGSQHFKQEMQTFAPTAREAAVKGLELLSPESSHA